MHAAEIGLMDGDYFTLPVEVSDEVTIPARRVAMASSLAGACRGEFVPVELAEIRVPANLTDLRTPKWGVFRRARLENRRMVDHRKVSSVIEAWERL